MSLANPSNLVTPGLIARVKGILTSPATEWDKIDAEPASIGAIYSGYVFILAAIPALARLIRGLAFGYGAFGLYYRPSVVAVVVQAVVTYVVSLAMVYVMALVIDGLAPNFGGRRDRVQAFKIAAYGATAAWLAGVFQAVPGLAVLWLAGLYSLYLLYLGLPRLMKTAPDQALGYTAVTVVVAIVVGFVLGAVAEAVESPFGGVGPFSGRMFNRHDAVVGSVNLPGGGTADLGQLNAAAKQAQLAAASIQAAQTGQAPPAGAIKPVPAEALKALLPDSLAGFARTEISSGSGGMAGVSASNAEASYAKGDGHITLSVTDMGSMGAMAAMAGVSNVQSSRETATGYEKVGTVDGRLTSEDYDRQNHSGKFSVMVGSRFMVEAHGDHVSIDDLKSAVTGVGFGRLEGLAHAG